MRTSDSSLWAELKAAGFTLTAEGSRLRVAPADKLTDDLRTEIRAHRAGLIALLAAESAPAVESYPSSTPAEKIAPRVNMVACGTCQHFLPDYVEPSQGLGRCVVTGTGPPAGGNGYGACFPMAPRRCPAYQPRNER
jgi:hypothetical protein